MEDGSNTDNRLGVAELILAPHATGPSAHWHEMHNEIFLVTKGTVRFFGAGVKDFQGTMLAEAHAGERDEVAVDVGVYRRLHYRRDAGAAYICQSERGRGAVHQHVHAGFLRQLFQANGGFVAGAFVCVPYLILPLAFPRLPSAPGTHWPSSRELTSGCTQGGPLTPEINMQAMRSYATIPVEKRK